MLDPIWLKALLRALVLPPTGPLLLAVVGLVLYARTPRIARVLVALGVIALWLLSTPAIAVALLRWLDQTPPLDLRQAQAAQAIVVLGGGIRQNAAEYDGDTLGRLTLERVRYGARVARLMGLPVLVTGGSVHGGEPEGLLMQRSLEDEFGVPVKWIEDQSRTTHQNAVFSARLLRANGIERVVLVAHGFDIPRASAEFEAQGIRVFPAPTGIASQGIYGPLDFVPSLAGLTGSYYALYEILAIGVFKAGFNR